MNSNGSGTNDVRKTKRRIGIIAIVLLMLFTVLALLRIINFIEWIILDLVVALVANLLFRRLNKQSL